MLIYEDLRKTFILKYLLIMFHKCLIFNLNVLKKVIFIASGNNYQTHNDCFIQINRGPINRTFQHFCEQFSHSEAQLSKGMVPLRADLVEPLIFFFYLLSFLLISESRRNFLKKKEFNQISVKQQRAVVVGQLFLSFKVL